MSLVVKLRERKLKNNCRSFYLDVYDDGKRSYIPISVRIDPRVDDSQQRKEKYEIVNAMRSQIETELLCKGTNIVPKHKRNIDFYDYLENYLEAYEKKDVKMIHATIQKFMDFNNKDHLYVTEVTEALLEQYRDYLISPKSKLSGETPHNYFSRFKKVIKAATKEGILKSNPAADVIFKNNGVKETLRKEILTGEELALLASTHCGNSEVKRAFLLACYTGMGIAEIKILTWEHVKNGRLNIKREKTQTWINIELSPVAIQLIGEKDASKKFIFDLKISDTAVNKNIDNWVKRAGIDKHITFYCGRHSYAILLLSNNNDLKTVSDCLGHSGVRNTVKYLNHTDGLKDKAIQSLPSIKLNFL